MVILPQAVLSEIEAAAARAWPEECCGLLAGRAATEGAVEVLRAVPSRNLAADPRTGFEIDPQLWLDLRRRLAPGPDTIVGLYHSHPDGAGGPSPRDADAAWMLEPGAPALVWLITAARAGKAAGTQAHLFHGAGKGFAEAPLRILD